MHVIINYNVETSERKKWCFVAYFIIKGRTPKVSLLSAELPEISKEQQLMGAAATNERLIVTWANGFKDSCSGFVLILLPFLLCVALQDIFSFPKMWKETGCKVLFLKYFTRKNIAYARQPTTFSCFTSECRWQNAYLLLTNPCYFKDLIFNIQNKFVQ